MWVSSVERLWSEELPHVGITIDVNGLEVMAMQFITALETAEKKGRQENDEY